MLSKIKKLFSDNRLKDLLAGNMVLSVDVINEFIRLKGLPPGLALLELGCSEGEIGVKAEGGFRDLEFRAEVWTRLLSVRVTSKEQIVKVMPAGTTRIKTQNADLQVTLKPGDGLIKEIRSIVEYLPPEVADGVEIEDHGVKLLLHKIPFWAREFDKWIKQIPLFSELKINLLDYVVIHDIRIEERAVRIMARRN
jgi:hypothetical protein